MNNVAVEDGGSYACSARLTHLGRHFTIRNYIAVNTSKVLFLFSNMVAWFSALWEPDGFLLQVSEIGY